MKYVTIVAEDKPGLLADISYVLGKSGISVNDMNLDVVGGKALIALRVRDPKKAKGILESNGYNTAELDALVIKVSQRIGGMAAIAERLSRSRISISGMQEISAAGEDQVFSIHVDKPRKATRMLSDCLLSAC